jgi:hypothetical protein
MLSARPAAGKAAPASPAPHAPGLAVRSRADLPSPGEAYAPGRPLPRAGPPSKPAARACRR